MQRKGLGVDLMKFYDLLARRVKDRKDSRDLRSRGVIVLLAET